MKKLLLLRTCFLCMRSFRRRGLRHVKCAVCAATVSPSKGKIMNTTEKCHKKYYIYTMPHSMEHATSWRTKTIRRSRSTCTFQGCPYSWTKSADSAKEIGFNVANIFRPFVNDMQKLFIFCLENQHGNRLEIGMKLTGNRHEIDLKSA